MSETNSIIVMLDKGEKEKLLKIARQTLETYIKTSKIADFEVRESQLCSPRGAFVTIKKEGELRGCIGRIQTNAPLYKTIQEMTIEAAINDPRFLPVSSGELKEIEIEISILSELKKIDNIEEIEVGRHGILLRRGINSGLLLPQVATEYGWDREEFLKHSCYKAGLPSDAWKEKNTEIYIFSAEVFSEKDL